MRIEEYETIVSEARSRIPAGQVSWAGSPWAWMLHNGPPTKSALGRDLAKGWAEKRYRTVLDGDGGTYGHHLKINGSRVAVHFAMLGKEGSFRFSALREPEMGIDAMLLIGVEPNRTRFWRLSVWDTSGLPTFSGDKEGLHSLAFDPTDPPEFLDLLDEVNTNHRKEI